MPIAFGPTDIQKVYLGSTALTQVYLGTVPLLETVQVDMPPITDGLFLLLDAGVLDSYGGSGNVWNDIAGYVDGPYPYTKNASVSFNGEAGVRGNSTYFQNEVENENMSETPPGEDDSQLSRMHQRNIGPYTYILITDLDNGAVDDSPGWLLANGINQGSNRAQFTGGDSNGNITIDFGGRTNGITWNGAPTGNFPEGWKDRFRPRMITVVGDSSDSADCFTKLDGFPAQPINTTHGNSNTSTPNPKLGLYANGLTNVGTRYYGVLCYNRKLTEAEVQQLEDFYMPYFPDPADSVRGSWGVRNLEPTDSGGGRQTWRLDNVVPVVAGVPDYSGYGAVLSLTQSGWANSGNITEVSNNSSSIADVDAANVEEILSAFYNTVDADQMQVYQGSSATRNHLSRMMVVSSDDQGVTTYDVAKIKAYLNRSNYGGTDPANYRFGVPTAFMTANYSMEARSIIANYPEATVAEMNALATFIDTLQTNGYLDRLCEMYPLFLSGEIGLRSFFRAPDLIKGGNPVKLDGGFFFESNSDYLVQPSNSRWQEDGQWPHKFSVGAAAYTMYQLSSESRPGDTNFYRVFGGYDGTRRCALSIQPSDGRVSNGVHRTSFSTGTSGRFPDGVLPIGQPLTWYKNSSNHLYSKAGADAVISQSTSSGTVSDLPQTQLQINGMSTSNVPDTSVLIGGTWGMFAYWDMDGLVDGDRETMLATIHAAVQTMMDALGHSTVIPPVTYDPIESSPDWTLLYGTETGYKLVDDLVDEVVSLDAVSANNATASRGQAVGTDIELEVDWLTADPTLGDSWSFPLIIRADAANTNLIGVRVMDNELQAQAFENSVWGTTHTIPLSTAGLPGKMRFRAVGTTVSVFVDDVLKITFETTNVSGGDHYGVRTAPSQAFFGDMWKNLIVRDL